MIRILVIPPVGAPPRLETVPAESWQQWYPLVHPATDTLQPRGIAKNVLMLFDEVQRDDMPLNFLLAGRAPTTGGYDFIIDRTDGQGMQPGQEGVGYHRIYGTVLITRVGGMRHVDLTDDDIEFYTRTFGHTKTLLVKEG